MEAVLEVEHAGCYTSDLTRRFPVAITVLSGHRTPEGSVGLWELSGPDEALPGAFEALTRHPHILRADVLRKAPGHWILETLDVEAEVSNALVDAGLVFLPPVIIRGGTETYRVFALDREQVQRAVRSLEPQNRVTVRSVRERSAGVGPLARLTEKQRDVLEHAYRRGYYKRPRTVDQEALARELGMSRPTLAEHLARAERKVMGAVFGEE